MVCVGTEPNALPTPKSQLSALTYVLRYDDLLAEQTGSFLILNSVPTLKVGRAESGCGHHLRLLDVLLIDDSLVSSHHCEILSQDGGDLLVDRGSRNGTFVNGQRVVEQQLQDGDLIEIGRSLLCYRRADAQILHELVNGPPAMIGPSRTHNAELLSLSRNIRAIAPTRESVLLLGETGSGKEIVAQAVHAHSGRSGALRVVDCGAIPENLFESELFGHRRGAFTGAVESHVGEIARAQHGTLFLDEVANMSLAAQAKLLRVLEDGQVAAVGSAKKESLDVRWIAATNVDLFNCPGFRHDVLQRLAGFVARLPPLRERREDLGVLTAHLLRQAGITRAAMTVSAGRQFFTSAFPGNIRQLRNELRSAAALAGERLIESAHLQAADPVRVSRPPEPPRSRSSRETPPIPHIETPSRTAPDVAEIAGALHATQGNVVRAAQLLQTHPRQLYRWLDRLNIPLEQFRKS